jgi:hypothetical protein
MAGLRLSPARLALMPVLAGVLASGAGAAQDQVPAPAPASRTEASQIELPQSRAATGPGRAYLDEAGRPAAPPPPRASLIGDPGPALTPAESAAPATQISTASEGSPRMAQLSSADLDATLAQLSPVERRVLLEAIAGTDICDNPPQVAAIIALCRTRIETRSGDFAERSENLLSAEDRLLRGDLESYALPSIAQVIERLARGGASSGDLSNQEIAAIALGTNAPPADGSGDKEPTAQPQVGENAQALINALINQLGGRAP